MPKINEEIEKSEEELENEILENGEETEEVQEVEGQEEATEEVEPWMAEEEGETVPLGALLNAKAKLKGRINEGNEENERLRAEVEALKRGSSAPQQQHLPVRPKLIDFESDDAYELALDKYENDSAVARHQAISRESQRSEQQERAKQALESDVNSHYDRVDVLIQKHGISPEVYKQADTTVRATIERSFPKMGDLVTDQIISILGEGSEKVLFHLGRNKAALANVQTLFQTDPSGMKLAVYLGQKKAELNNPSKRVSKAPRPASNAPGDKQAGPSGKALRAKYDKAHKGGNSQDAYNAKKQARSAGVDVKNW